MHIHRPIIIIGSGLAGYTLAREFRKLDATTPLLIITEDDGVYYSKPQLSSAFTHHKSAEALAMASTEKMAKQLNLQIQPFTTITYIDTQQQIIYSAQQSFHYSKLILALGARPVQLPFLTQQEIPWLSINNLLDYRHFRQLCAEKKNITIIGAGLVGCEFTNDLVNGGFQINVIALSPTPLELLLPPELGEVLRIALTEIGVNWYLGCSVKNLGKAAGKIRLELSNQQVLTTDLIISAIGLKPVIELAAQSQINTRRGIIVDEFLQTNQPNVYALGDCAEVAGHILFYVAPLVIGARALAHTLTGQATAVSYPPMPVILKTPACPVVANPPLATAAVGHWEVSGQGHDQRALFYNAKQQLCGFGLTGTCVNEKNDLVKQLPNIL